MTTVHAYTNDQVLTDVYEDLRRARSATMSMIPTKTGAAAAVGLVLPELNGKLDGYAIRVPTINVSIVDLSFVASANDRRRSEQHPEGRLRRRAEGHPDYNTEPLVSVDYNHNPASSTVDASLTKVSGRLVKVSSWYDNEWGFSNRMLDTTVALMSASKHRCRIEGDERVFRHGGKRVRPLCSPTLGSKAYAQGTNPVRAGQGRRPVRQARVHPRRPERAVRRRRPHFRRHPHPRLRARHSPGAGRRRGRDGHVPPGPPERGRADRGRFAGQGRPAPVRAAGHARAAGAELG